MGLTSALFTGLSGLNTNQFRLDVLGDNIANINTNGFKGSRSLFQTQFSRTLSTGSRPSGATGGTNPTQIGLGSVLGAIQRDFGPGAIETTTSKLDLAVEGEGFFVLRTPDIDQVYTRDGSFTLSADNFLVNADGFFVQGFGIDNDFNIVPGVLSDIQIPLGILSTSRATTEARLNGTLDGGATVATLGSITTSGNLFAGAAAATAATALTGLSNTSGGPVLFATGDTITVDGLQKGGRKLPTETFVVGTTGSTLGDFAAWLEDVIGINTTTGLPPTEPTGPIAPGVRINASGQIEIDANVGLDNAINVGPSVFRSSNTTTPAPFTFANTQKANGDGVFTSMTIFDSIGNKVRIEVTMVKETLAANTIWRFYVESADDSDLDRVLSTGTLTFDANGDFTSATGTQVSVDRLNTGAVDPLVFDLQVDTLNGLVSNSVLVMTGQNGFPPGTLTDVGIGSDGLITGLFSNGLTRTLGQLPLATFSNPPGLIAKANTLYLAGPNSGEAQITAPQTLGAGSILSGAIELSNVDLSRQFIDIITASTGFSAASRVISTSDELLDELLLLAR